MARLPDFVVQFGTEEQLLLGVLVSLEVRLEAGADPLP
jgi:hypothetical protein